MHKCPGYRVIIVYIVSVVNSCLPTRVRRQGLLLRSREQIWAEDDGVGGRDSECVNCTLTWGVLSGGVQFEVVIFVVGTPVSSFLSAW